MLQTTHVFLFNSKNQVLLGMKKRWFGEGKWNGFGGKNKWDETIIQTALRELHEESGVLLNPEQVDKAGILHFYREDKSEWDQDCHIYWWYYDWPFEETNEMRPQWWDFDKIPYELMWEDDNIRFPKLLAKQFPMDIDFTFNTDWKLIKFFDKNNKI